MGRISGLENDGRSPASNYDRDGHELRIHQPQQEVRIIDEHWLPKVIVELNDFQFKIVKLQGDFIWHDHQDTDDAFIVIEDDLRIDFRDGAVRISTGEMFVVPKSVEHKPYAENEVRLLPIVPRGVLNTGHEGGHRASENDDWI